MSPSLAHFGARFLLVAYLALGLSACKARDTEAPAVKPPAAEFLRAATHPDYVPVPGQKQECLGRLVFNVTGEMQWAGHIDTMAMERLFRFTENMKEGDEDARFANMDMAIYGPAKPSDLEGMVRSLEAGSRIGIRKYQSSIKSLSGLIEDLKINRNKEDPEGVAAAIKDHEADIERMKNEIAEIETKYKRFDLGIPDSIGYGQFHAFIFRDGRVFSLSAGYNNEDQSLEEKKAAFIKTVQSLRFRKLYEIPKERGLCLPYVFIPDNGDMPFSISVGMRYADRPNVLYRIATRYVDDKFNPYPEQPLIQSVAFASIGLLPGADHAEAARRETARIGPRQVKIGALVAAQGGGALNAGEGKKVIPSYSVFTGHSGWQHSQVLPSTTVIMRSFTRAQEPSFKTEPPPFDESMKRLDALLASIRLRPTTPLMPELEKLEEVQH